MDPVSGALLLQVPVPVASVKVIVALIHTAFGPVIIAGLVFTVTILVATQPVAIV